MSSKKINLTWLGIEGELYTFMPDWLGKIVCNYKDHEWELIGEFCSRCGLDGRS